MVTGTKWVLSKCWLLKFIISLFRISIHINKCMYKLPLGMKILIQRETKPFNQRENSVLKRRQHTRDWVPSAHTKEWTKMENCPKTDYTPEPEHAPSSCLAKVCSSTIKGSYGSPMLQNTGRGDCVLSPGTLLPHSPAKGRPFPQGISVLPTCEPCIHTRSLSVPLPRPLHIFFCLGSMTNNFL